MPTTQQYLNQLQADKTNLVSNLITKGVQASSSETFTSLVPKVLDISSGAEPNIFVQTIEPDKKDGLWIQTDKTYTKTIIDENVQVAGSWEASNNVPSFPGSYNNYKGIQVGNYYYLWTSGKSSGDEAGYKYSFENNTWSSIRAKKWGTYMGGGIGSDGNYISFQSAYYDHIYDINNNQMNDLSQTSGYKPSVNSPSQVMKNKIIYMFGEYNDSRKAFKVDFTNDISNPTRSVLAYPPGSMTFGHESILIEDDVYIFGCANNSSSSSNRILKYNISNNSYELLTQTLPNGNFSSSEQKTSLIKIDNYIYFPPTTNRKAIYRFNLTNYTFEQYAGMPEGISYFYDCGLAYYNNKLYFIGGYNNDGSSTTAIRNTKTLQLSTSTYNQDSLIITQGKLPSAPYYTKLYDNNFIGNLVTPILNAYMYNNNTFYSNLPTYIGNGTSWTKIKG